MSILHDDLLPHDVSFGGPVSKYQTENSDPVVGFQ